jgi:hypothetical protein
MNNEPRQKLRELIAEYGRSLCTDPNRCEALLKDYCGVHKREIFVLVSALKNHVVDDLLKSPAEVPKMVLIARLSTRLESELALTIEAAHWAVESWAWALDFVNVPSPTNKLAAHSKPTTGNSSDTPVVSPARDAEGLMAGRYRDNNDGTVTDTTTSLQWMRFSLGQEWKNQTCIGAVKRFTWPAAMAEAKFLNLQSGYAGHRDWRLPSRNELLSLVFCSSGRPKTWNDTGKICEGDFDNPTIDQHAFPGTPSSYYWSGSPCADGLDGGWNVYFGTGAAYCGISRGLTYVVRFVRTMQ